ncbi:villin [Cavenderia fasciculata]|uniref:Villin n=1 Tax=Cavenderia fasciculata TaxID=261658 RepID=F4Q384_CACFS|nr:villin [Cavenderia fasciculata]EGG17594.1 villin [Cavenderia fasciculata]|eukprot:XP_004356078.1 villin [Cavenderia fasciculata]
MEYKTLEKSIVRDSKVRNVFHKSCKKELFYTNLKVNSSAEELLKSSKSLFAYPTMIGGGSCLCISKLTSYGKAPDNAFHIKAHPDPITCFEFSPFNERVLATGSRDCSIKLWSLGDEDGEDVIASRPFIQDPLITLPRQSKRITGVYFHPSVDSLFVSASAEFAVDLWDLGKGEASVLQKATGATDNILSLAWNTWSGGNMFATSSRDKKMRLYDPRHSGLPVREVVTHEGAQGFKLAWADSGGIDMLCTVGANKSAQRQLFLWDPRQMGQALNIVNVTTDSSVLTPYYDFGTNILYLGGKGDVSEEEGGKNKQKDKLDQLAGALKDSTMIGGNTAAASEGVLGEGGFLTEGDIKQEIEGWLFNTYHPRYLKIIKDRVYCFLNEEAAQSLWDFSVANIKYVDIYDNETTGSNSPSNNEWSLRFNIIHNNLKEYKMECSSVEHRDAWIASINAHREMKKEEEQQKLQQQEQQKIQQQQQLSNTVNKDLSPTLADFHIVNQSPTVPSPASISKGQSDQGSGVFAVPNLPASATTPSGTGTIGRKSHSLLARNPSYTSLKLSGGMAPPPSTTPTSESSSSSSSSSTFLSTNSALPAFGSAASIQLVQNSNQPQPPQQQQSTNNTTNTSGQTIIIKLGDIIIEGSLFELVPGLIWNSNVEKWYIVSEGMLYSYKTKQLARTGDPLETIHLEKALSVHKTKDIFKIQGFSFQLTTPNRIIHLLAKNKDEMKSWISVLRQNLKSSGESKPTTSSSSTSSSRPSSLNNSSGMPPLPPGALKDQQQLDGADQPLNDDGENNQGGEEEVEEEEEMLEGMISRKLNGIFSMWGNVYMSLLAEDLFISKNKMATTPEMRIQLSSVSQIKKLSPTEFSLFDSAGAVVCNFRTLTPPTEEFDDCQRWFEGLEAARKRSIDVIKMFGLSERDESLAGSFSSPSSSASNLLSSETDNGLDSKYWDLTALKNGKLKMLIQIKGKRKIRAVMTKLSPESLNTNNSFVLDAGPRIFVWAGAKSSRVNRAKALDLANRIRQKERGGKSTLIQLDEGRDDSDDFWFILGGRDKFVMSGATRNAVTPEEQDSQSVRMAIYRIGIDSKKNSLRARLAWEGSDWRLPNKELLHTKYVYVVDCPTEIYVWIGKESAATQRRMGSKVALALLAQKDRADWVRVTRLTEFGENNLFKEKFANYPGMLPISTTKQETKSHIATTKAEHKPEVLVARLQASVDYVGREKIFTGTLTDAVDQVCEGNGHVKVWKINDFEKIEHPLGLYGQFFAGDSYIVLYTYMVNNKEAHVIYYYLGRDSTINDKGTSAYLTVELHESLSGACVQVRVVQNKESRNFLNIFRGKMLVHTGKYSQFDRADTAVYEVRGIDAVDSRAVQVDTSARVLNSQHVFIVSSPATKTVYQWNGANSLQTEKDAAASIIQKQLFKDKDYSDHQLIVVEQGNESDAFWTCLKSTAEVGVTQYHRDTNSLANAAAARLFVCSNSSGINEILEEGPFNQDDLEIGNVGILDARHTIYLWLGTRAPHRTKKCAMESVIALCKQSKLGHTEQTPIVIVEPYHEPLEFRSYFRAWIINASKYPKSKLPFLEKAAIPVQSVLKDYLKEIYTYEELLADPLPAGIDGSKLECYLPDDEFVKIFQMSRQEWEKIPGWRRENIKRSVYLY